METREKNAVAADFARDKVPEIVREDPSDSIHCVKSGPAAGAYQSFDEDEKGTLAVGKRADLVVLSGNPVDMPPRELLSLGVVTAISRGRVVYQR